MTINKYEDIYKWNGSISEYQLILKWECNIKIRKFLSCKNRDFKKVCDKQLEWTYNKSVVFLYFII